MSKEQVKAVLDRVLTWPSERQEDAAKLLMLMESQDESVYRLTDEQVEEVRRRMADPNRKLVSAAEARERIARLPRSEANEAP
jgi:RAB protein geranylgeranyltransferase component A